MIVIFLCFSISLNILLICMLSFYMDLSNDTLNSLWRAKNKMRREGYSFDMIVKSVNDMYCNR